MLYRTRKWVGHGKERQVGERENRNKKRFTWKASTLMDSM